MRETSVGKIVFSKAFGLGIEQVGIFVGVLKIKLRSGGKKVNYVNLKI